MEDSTILMQASNEWMKRPDDQRFTSLLDLQAKMSTLRENSSSRVISSRALEFMPAPGNPRTGLVVRGQNGGLATTTNWSFGQVAKLAGAPAGYLRKLPAPIAADCLNYGMKFDRNVEDVGVLVTKGIDGSLPTVRAATGPNYGRVWNAELADSLVDRFGDGITGDWRVPGEFGKEVTVTKANTTIYASDRDAFVFLADERNRIEVPNRRDGKPGSLARGFFVWNSEVGAGTLGAAFFLFDFVCCNRIVWGAQQFTEIRVRHTAGAPDRWLEEITPVLTEYANASAAPVVDAIAAAQRSRLDDVDKFLVERFGAHVGLDVKDAHEREEGRPIETLWDVTVGASAYAKELPNQSTRVKVEREAGKIMALAS